MLLANIIWGLNAPIAKTVLAEFTALSVTTFRMVGAAITFWIFSLFLPKEHVNPKDLLKMIYAEGVGVVIKEGLFKKGM